MTTITIHTGVLDESMTDLEDRLRVLDLGPDFYPYDLSLALRRILADGFRMVWGGRLWGTDDDLVDTGTMRDAFTNPDSIDLGGTGSGLVVQVQGPDYFDVVASKYDLYDLLPPSVYVDLQHTLTYWVETGELP